MNFTERDRIERLVARFNRAGATARATALGGLLVQHGGRTFHVQSLDIQSSAWPQWIVELLSSSKRGRGR